MNTEGYIGIDNGLSGAIALVKGSSLVVSPMPTRKLGKGRGLDRAAFFKMAKHWRQSGYSVVVEMPEKHSPGVLALCSTWHCSGGILMALEANNVRYHEVRANQWQRLFWSRPKMAKGQKFDTKHASLAAAKKLWPHEKWLRSERCKTPDSGMADAALIAEYGRIKRL